MLSLFDDALERPMLDDIGRAHFEFSRLTAHKIDKNFVHQTLPRLISEGVMDDVDNLLNVFYNALEGDDGDGLRWSGLP
jgi:hypothetical protein